MSHLEVLAYLKSVDLKDFLKNINIKDFLPDVGPLNRESILESMKKVLVYIEQRSHIDHPQFPVFVCSVFIVVLCMAGLLLRYIYRRLQHQRNQENIEKQKEIKGPAGTRGQHVQQIQESASNTPKPTPRWKKPVIQTKDPVKITGLKQEAKNWEPKQLETKKWTPKPSDTKKVEPKKTEFKKWEPKQPVVKEVQTKKVELEEKKEEKKEENKEEKKGWFWNKKKEDDSSNDEKARGIETKETISKEDETKDKTTKRQKKDVAPPVRSFNLNIDPNARNVEESKRMKQAEIELLRTMGKEFREMIKLDEAGEIEREEKKKEMEKVKSARWYFKEAERKRSESAAPTSRFRVEDENLEGTGLSVGDLNLVKRRSNFYQGNQDATMRLSQFEPGRLNKTFTNLFENGNNGNQELSRPPRKKLITLDQILKKDLNEADVDLERRRREEEIRELKEARKRWIPPQDSPKPMIKEKIEVGSESVKKRWIPGQSDRQEKAKSAEDGVKHDEETKHEIQDELDQLRESRPTPVTQRWNQNTGDEVQGCKKDVDEELNEIRAARPTPVTKRWKPIGQDDRPVRSKSAHVLQRARLADDSWVQEKSSKLEEEKRRAAMELDLVRKARLEAEEEKIYDFTNTRMIERRKEAILELETVKSLRKNQQQEDLEEAKEDPRDARKSELEQLMKIRATGKEFAVESTPSKVPMPKPKEEPFKPKQDLAKPNIASAKPNQASAKPKQVTVSPNPSVKQQTAAPARNTIALSPSSVSQRGQSKSAERNQTVLTHSKSAEIKKEPVKSVGGVKKSKSNESTKEKDAAKKFENDRSRSREKKVSVGKQAKSKSPEVKPQTVTQKEVKQVSTKVVKSNSGEVKTSKIIKSSSSESNKSKIVQSTSEPKGLSKSGSGDKSESKAVYAKVIKSTKTSSEQSEVTKEDKKEIKQTLISQSKLESSEPAPKKDTPKKPLDNKINFDDLSGYQIDKCDLKAKDDGIKLLPTRVINCTPKPFKGVSNHNSEYPIKMTQPLLSPQPNVYEQISSPNQEFAEPPVCTNPNSKAEKKVSKQAKLNKANKESAKEDSAGATKENVISQEELKNILSDTSEFESSKKVGNKNVRFNQRGEKEKTLIQENKVEIEVKVKEERRTSVEEGNEEGKRDSRIVTKFREFKEKTVLEVNKITRGRSLQRAPVGGREKEEGEDRKEGEEKEKNEDIKEGEETSRRSRSESRSQKAGRMMKDFTSNILKKR